MVKDPLWVTWLGFGLATCTFDHPKWKPKWIIILFQFWIGFENIFYRFRIEWYSEAWTYITIDGQTLSLDQVASHLPEVRWLLSTKKWINIFDCRGKMESKRLLELLWSPPFCQQMYSFTYVQITSFLHHVYKYNHFIRTRIFHFILIYGCKKSKNLQNIIWIHKSLMSVRKVHAIVMR